MATKVVEKGELTGKEELTEKEELTGKEELTEKEELTGKEELTEKNLNLKKLISYKWNWLTN